MNGMEFMEEGVLTTIIGMGVVFAVLIILSFFIKMLNSGVEAAEGRKVPKNKVAEFVPPSPVKAPEACKTKNSEGLSPAVVAAITASICALTGKTAEEFKFNEIRRVSASQPIWAMIGTADIMSTRQRFIERGNR